MWRRKRVKKWVWCRSWSVIQVIHSVFIFKLLILFTVNGRIYRGCKSILLMARQFGKGSLMNSKSKLCQGSPGACSDGRVWKVQVKCLYLYWITLLFTQAVLHKSSATTGGNRSTQRKPAMFGWVKLDSTLLTFEQGNFNQIYISAWSRSRTFVTVLRVMHYHCVNKHLP